MQEIITGLEQEDIYIVKNDIPAEVIGAGTLSVEAFDSEKLVS